MFSGCLPFSLHRTMRLITPGSNRLRDGFHSFLFRSRQQYWRDIPSAANRVPAAPAEYLQCWREDTDFLRCVRSVWVQSAFGRKDPGASGHHRWLVLLKAGSTLLRHSGIASLGGQGRVLQQGLRFIHTQVNKFGPWMPWESWIRQVGDIYIYNIYIYIYTEVYTHR